MMDSGNIKIIEKHSRVLRWLHWINVPLLGLMIWSGVLIYWANQAYFRMPPSLAEFLHLDYRLSEGMGWHFLIMWPLIINGLGYLVYLAISGDWKEIFPDAQTLSELPQVIMHELKLGRRVPENRGKFNAAQRVAYSGAIFLGIGAVLTGLSIWKPVQLGWLTSLLGGYEAARLEHFIIMMGFVIFISIHVIQVLKAGWNNLRAMIAGYEIEKE